MVETDQKLYEKQIEEKKELNRELNNLLSKLGFSLDVRGWGEDLDLTDRNDVERISNVLGNILISAAFKSKNEQDYMLTELQKKIPAELVMVQSLVRLFSQGFYGGRNKS